jgi:signal transduction histidine kinase
VDLEEITRECVAIARTRFHLPDAALTFDPRTSAPAVVIGDADELKAAVWNLIDNAVKYSASNPNVNITLEETADHTRYALRVADRGAGISPTELKRVFRRFYRIHGMSVRAKGSGLGLFIVRSVARRHGGKAFAESPGTGHGSTFTLLLPRPPEPA